MRTSSILLISATFVISAAFPAIALEHQLGAVNVSADEYTKVTWSRFDGDVRRLALVPENDTVRCNHITVHYRNGISYDVFEGTLTRGSTETITFPQEGDNRVRDVDFACRAENLDGARIALFAVSDGDGFADDQAPARVRTHEDDYPDDF
jgi:hypothetical protein